MEPAATPADEPKPKRAALVAYEQSRKRSWIPFAALVAALAFGGAWLHARSQPAKWVRYEAPDKSFAVEFSTAPVRRELKPAVIVEPAPVPISVLESHDDEACEILRVTSWDLPARLDAAAEGAYLDEVAADRRKVFDGARPTTAVTLGGRPARKFTAVVPRFYRVTLESRFQGTKIPGSQSSYDLVGALTYVVLSGGGTRYYGLEAVVSESHVGESDARFFGSFQLAPAK